MIELRWLVNNDNSRRLQYRQKVDTTIRAGLWSNPVDIMQTANYQWSDWADVPEAYDNRQNSLGTNKCPKCGLDLTATMSYTCTQLNCPTGLGSSVS